jgi:bifunctional non-homologous end joining protein LigD
VTGAPEVQLTNLDRILFPAPGFTKGDLVAYYEAVAPVLLPHLSGRPLTLGRFPAGIDGGGFATTECRGRPEWMRTAPVRLRSGEIRNHCVVDDLRSLLWVANLGTIELHAFPTGLVVDLDPGPRTGVLDCARVALRLRELLAAEGIEPFAKTTGSLGLHVHAGVALDRAAPLARAVAKRLANEQPETVTDSRDPAARSGRVLVDWLQSNPRVTTILPYSLRATDHPRVAAPVTWEELAAAIADEHPEALHFAPDDVVARTQRLGDPMRPVANRENG